MKNYMFLLTLTLSMPCHSMHQVRRTYTKHTAIGIAIISSLWLYWYKEKLALDKRQVNAFDKEIVTQFYEKNPYAQTKLYQQLKKEAQNGDILWYDVFPHGKLRNRGSVDNKFPTLHNSKATECDFYYNMDSKTKKYFLEYYDCTAHLRRGEIKKCLQESIKEGRLE